MAFRLTRICKRVPLQSPIDDRCLNRQNYRENIVMTPMIGADENGENDQKDFGMCPDTDVYGYTG